MGRGARFSNNHSPCYESSVLCPQVYTQRFYGLVCHGGGATRCRVCPTGRCWRQTKTARAVTLSSHIFVDVFCFGFRSSLSRPFLFVCLFASIKISIASYLFSKGPRKLFLHLLATQQKEKH